MGKVFFNDWELWQKMTFVLACGIVITIIVGLIKLQYDNYRVRKYSKPEKGKKPQTPEMLEAQPVVSKTKNDIPFGIRAIESGIEVDGVWISRSNTPVGSSRSSITETRLPRSLNNSQLELPKPVHGSSSRDSSRAPSSGYDRAVSAERIPTNDSRTSSPVFDAQKGSRVRPHVASVASSSRNPASDTARNSWVQAMEGIDHASTSSVRYEPTKAKPGSSNSGKSSGRTSDESDYLNLQDARVFEAAHIQPRNANRAVPTDPRSDLELLQSHRLSHVAETGQLTPRVRRPGYSGEWASVADNFRLPQDISSSNGVEYFVPRQKTPSPPLPPLPALPQEYVNQVRQPIPLLETYAPQATHMPESYQPRGPQHQYEEDRAQPKGSSQPSRSDSNVIRKVNSGFEILRPGTFGEPPSPEDEKLAIGEKRQSKRLQKKRRSSSSSNGRTSHFVEQV
ncbi:hypothetical protein BU24DRAFT_447621 [Aaosphaeria arxii CBS 175.79]|uniref:Uncharacterized protein n=1 Tax=Aaosphaeria arxii CBS 175.79 TaxID=1450172 RepID=A0A6A5Y2H9_9PLEO|nr:uncharacterized protein BU24DRAFT_447621 [Aaosphaeria arxii CBS 175.79]KAF2019030.1 hypothetical protein BU24DRAFT_447621 [Aaosphaeria arxii CBS 175.79]